MYTMVFKIFIQLLHCDVLFSQQSEVILVGKTTDRPILWFWTFELELYLAIENDTPYFLWRVRCTSVLGAYGVHDHSIMLFQQFFFCQFKKQNNQ